MHHQGPAPEGQRPLKHSRGAYRLIQTTTRPIELAYEGDDIGKADDPEALKDAVCPICQISKSTSKRVSHKHDVKDDDFLDPPKGPYEQLSTDNVIMARGEDFAGKGVGGVKAFHVIRDSFSGARITYPMSKRDASSRSKNFRRFLRVSLLRWTKQGSWNRLRTR